MQKNAFLMTLAPGEAKMAIHTLERILRTHEGSHAFVLDDCTSDGTWDTMKVWSERKANVTLLRNPEPFKYHGIAASVFRLLQEVSDWGPDIVVKLDPDAYIYDMRLVNRAADLFRESGPGIVGYTTHSPNGKKRSVWRHGLRAIMDSLPIRLGKRYKVMFGGAPFWRHFWRAIAHGYIPGSHPISLYVLDGKTVTALREYWSCLPTPHLGYLTGSDEVLVSIGVCSIGHKLIPLNSPTSEPIAWIKFRAPIGISDTDITSARFAALHPLKGEEGWRIRSLIDSSVGLLTRSDDATQSLPQ